MIQRVAVRKFEVAIPLARKICKWSTVGWGGAVASWLKRWRSEIQPWPRTLDCDMARHFTLTVPLSTQVYKWVPENLLLGVALRWTSVPTGGK